MKTELPLELIELEKQSYHLLLNVLINGKSCRMVLDTGASRTCFDISFLEKIEAMQISKQNDIHSSGLGGNINQSIIANIANFQLGDFNLCNYQVVGLNLEAVNQSYSLVNINPIQGILGGDILKMFGSVIRYDKKIMILKTRKPNPKAIFV